MTLQDPIADLFTRIRNALLEKHEKVVVPSSKMNLSIIKILKDEGFVKFYEMQSEDLTKKSIKIGLKYDKDGKSIITKIHRESTPGKRLYTKKKNVPKPLNGYGISIVSTSLGVITGKKARLANVGGELIGIVH